METWGRGIEKIKDSCAKAGTPMLEYTVKKEGIVAAFYIKETYIVTATAYNSEGDGISDKFTYVY